MYFHVDGLGEGCSLAVDANGDPTDLDFHLPAFLALRGPYAARTLSLTDLHGVYPE